VHQGLRQTKDGLYNGHVERGDNVELATKIPIAFVDHCLLQNQIGNVGDADVCETFLKSEMGKSEQFGIVDEAKYFNFPGYKPKRRLDSVSNKLRERHFLDLQGQVFCVDSKVSNEEGNEIKHYHHNHHRDVDDHHLDGDYADTKGSCDHTLDTSKRIANGQLEMIIVEYDEII
jgi:hypothetical protein